MKKKPKIIALILLLLLGVGSLLYAMFGQPVYDDVFSLTDAVIGKTVTVPMSEPLPADDQNWVMSYDKDDDYIELRVVLPEKLVRRFKKYADTKVAVTGIVRQADAEMHDSTYAVLIDYINMIASMNEEFEYSDAEKKAIHDKISPYYIEVTAVNNGLIPALKTAAWIAGIVLLLAAVVVLIALISDKAVWKIALTVFLIVAVPAAIIGIVCMNKIRSICSIRKDGEGVYYMEYKGALKLDDMINAGITSDAELFEWFRKAEFYHLPIHWMPDHTGCASFKAMSPEGDVLFGRNFDYPETDTLMIYTNPKDGYASYSMADLREMGISEKNGLLAPDAPFGRIYMLAAPYVVCDGVNEAGLGVSTLEQSAGELHQDTGKPDLFVYTAIRLLLDRCATVDEAVEMLRSYDIHSHGHVRQHLFIVDKSGRSVVVEWIEHEMTVIEADAVTNSVLTPGKYYNRGADSRLPKINEVLSEHEGTLTGDEARDLLDTVSQENYTEWSCVYNVSDFAVDLYVDEDYAHAYHYGAGN